MKLLSFFVLLLLNGYAPVQAFAHTQDFHSPAVSGFHASTGTFLTNSPATLQINNPVSSPIHQESLEISNVTEVEEDDHFSAEPFHAHTITYVFGSPEKSLSFFKHLTSLSSRRYLTLRVIRI